MTPQLNTLFGSRSAAQVLLFLQNYGEGHALRIARTFDAPPTAIQRQLRRLEEGGLLVSRLVGRSRVYQWKPGSVTVKGLRAFLESELSLLPVEDTKAFFRERQRPRRLGKPL